MQGKKFQHINFYTVIFLWIPIFLLSLSSSWAQLSKTNIDSLKIVYEQNMVIAQNTIEQSSDKPTISLAQYRTILFLETQTKAYELLLQEEIEQHNREIAALQEVIEALNMDIDTLLKEYGEFVYEYSKLHSPHQSISLLLSSNSLSELYSRINLLDQYKKQNIKRLDYIEKTKKEIEAQQLELEKAQDKKSNTAAQAQIINEQLSLLKKEKTVYKTKFTPTKKKSYIAKEKKSFEKKITISTTKKEKSLALKPFKGKLPWPVEQGIVIKGYGQQKHPLDTMIRIFNPGIDIRSVSNQVQSVARGRVVAITPAPLYGQLLIVQHGDYLCLYSPLESTTVKVNEVVEKGQVIGTLEDEENSKIWVLQFQVWKGQRHQDPTKWLTAKNQETP